MTTIEWAKNEDGSAGETWNPTTEYRSVPGYDGYFITADGTMLGPRRRVLRPMAMETGHQYIYASRPGVPRKLFIHRAVLSAWVGPPGSGQSDGRHLNDDPSDNRVENLAWGTRLDNARDKARNGRQIRGEQLKTAKLTEADVREIRRRWPAETTRALGAEYGVSHTAIRRAVNGMKWRHVA